MSLLRLIAYCPPQLLLVLFFAGSLDLLGGWNQTDDAMMTLIALFILAPILAMILLVKETMCYWKVRGRKALLFMSLSILIFFQAMAVDFYLLTQVRM